MRAIDADALKKTLRDWIRGYWTDDNVGSEFANMIDHAETIEQSPIVHAHWIYGYTFPDGQYRKCSACNELIKAVANDGNFCGHCGAKMDEEDVDQIKRIEAEPVKHAHWVACEDEYEDEYKCSACGGIQFFAMTPQDEGWEYCPHCGAKMNEVEE